MKRTLLLLSLGLPAILLSSCAVVPHIDKAFLADYTMKPDRDPVGISMTEHMYFSREAAYGGNGVGGGGCGCN
ncbi:MAG: DUF4266 domain-containing protein [Verrucomicrobiota bacterium]